MDTRVSSTDSYDEWARRVSGSRNVRVVSRPATLTARRAAELRMEIALAARNLFLAEGSTSVTVERICAAVGIAPRTFHRHFPVKEDVVMPLFQRFGALSIEVLDNAAPTSDTVDTLVEAFATEVPKRGQIDIDRAFMALMIDNPQYRLRWLDWGEDLIGPVSAFLADRFDIGNDPFTRELPAQLVIQACRYAYVHWVRDGDFGNLRSTLRVAMQMIVRSLPTLPPPE